jgi:hypothetical protein
MDLGKSNAQHCLTNHQTMCAKEKFISLNSDEIKTIDNQS